jgi:hypothetical protein
MNPCLVIGWKIKTFRTDWRKPFLETAPYLIIVLDVFMNLVLARRKNNYYVQESVGIAAGFLLAAIHNAGLVSLTILLVQ